jgi:hypothetical protein
MSSKAEPKVIKPKTLRFAALVEISGKPQQQTLWIAPEKDKTFMKAVEQNRVVTLVQINVGTRKDYGIVGFFPEKKGTFLVFPKPISYGKGTKVTGINYENLSD